jgi:hypothetical protein
VAPLIQLAPLLSMKTEEATVLIFAKTELLMFVKIVVKIRLSVKTAQPLFGKIATLFCEKIGEVLTAPAFMTETDLFKDVIATIEVLFKGRIEVVTAPPDRGIEVGEAAVSFTKADSPVVWQRKLIPWAPGNYHRKCQAY